MALENMILTSVSEGLGTFNEKEVKEALKIPEHFEVLVMIAVGYIDEKLDLLSKVQHQIRSRKTLSEFVSL